MTREAIFSKVKELVDNISNSREKSFEERDVIYLLVEIYKIKERELGREEIKIEFPHTSFFRDWVVHTNLGNKNWVKEQIRLNNKDKLLGEILAIIEDEIVKDEIQSMWASFEKSLESVTKDQLIL